MTNFNWKRWITFAGYALFLLCLLALVFQVCRHAVAELNSDDSSEMILSQILSEEGGILSDNWSYSSEIRVFQMQAIWSALFRLFGPQADWMLVRITGTLIGYAILFASLFVLCWRMKAIRGFPFLALLWVVPFCNDYYQFVLRSPFYLPFIVLELIILALAVSYEQCAKRNTKILLLAASLPVSVLAGLCGIRLLIVFHLPMVMAALLLLWTDRSDIKRWLPLTVFGSGNLISAGAGYLFYSKVLMAHYPVASHFAWYRYSGFSFDGLQEAINMFLMHLGFRTGSLYSTDFIANVCCAVLLFITIYSAYTILARKDEYSQSDRFLVASYLSGLVVLTALSALTNMQFSSRYCLPVTVFTFPVIFVCFGRRVAGEKTVQNLAMLTLCVACVLLPGADWHYSKLIAPVDSERFVIQQTLVEKGYTDGFATFWNANVLTELSNGEIEVWTIEAPDSVEKLSAGLQKRTHAIEKPEGKVFLLLSSAEKEQCPVVEKADSADVIYSSDSFVAYGFESYEELTDMCNTSKTTK